ncbi:putative gamma-tubulin complex component 2 [Filobasidium floriforme]|uniref:putative gamma-tubulin complex component 2 n=1 Tax=Filobasidium floriforme TaxID=5210 RepID=UPI001E8DB44F|nr:putative gamma-tubulin complex component 2 [Filobasidium floriforme]KAH8090462.1 putative gamma-tubulin complex component 2 [Filobasidium floriforme]
MSRPSSSASSHRPPTSTSSRAPPPIHTQTQTTVTVPFTPRPKHQSRDKLQGEHEFAQIVQNLASVRKIPKEVVRAELEAGGTGLDLGHGEDEVDPDRHLPAASSSTADKGKQRADAPDRYSSVHARAQGHGQHPRTGSTEIDDQDDVGSGGAPPLTGHGRYGRNINGHGARPGSGLGSGAVVAMEERKLDGVPLVVQEAWVCEDLRFVLQGVQGELITFAPDYDHTDEVQRLRGVRWKIDPSLDRSLRNMVEKILPLATFFTAVTAFLDLRNDTAYGMVNHALASGIRGVLRDYHILTAKLESLYLTSPDFTLQSAFRHLHPTLHILSLLYALCLALDNDPFPEFPDSGDEESEQGDGNEDMRDLAAELGLDLQQLGMASKKQLAREAASGNIMGGEVLGVILERAAATSGDPAAHSLYSSVLLHASQPYARILIKWITTGTLKDPYGEFLIKEDPRINKGQLVYDYSEDYWEQRYTLRDGSSLANLVKSYSDAPAQAFVPVCRPGTNRLPGGECIPPFLEPWKFKILLAGKYLNVIKECGIEIADWEAQDNIVAAHAEGALIRMDQPKFYQRIETAYFHSNKTLLDLILRDKQLITNLKSMKHFFFLDQSEFLNQFFDNAHAELKKTASHASMTKIQSLLYMAVSNPGSASSTDPHKEQLRAVLSDQRLYDHLLGIASKKAGEGILAAINVPTENKVDKIKEKDKPITTIEALSLDFDVQFPLSLVISRKTITRYQFIFRFLLNLRYLEFSLANLWSEHKTPIWRKSTGSSDIERYKRRIFVLRAQMMQWVQHMLAYVTGDVLETRWKKLEDKLSKVSTIDQLLRDHVEYLDTCLKECTLTEGKLISGTLKIVDIISGFITHHTFFTKILNLFNADPSEESTEGRIAQRWALFNQFDRHFRHFSSAHLDIVTFMASSEQPALLALVVRLTPLHDQDGK